MRRVRKKFREIHESPVEVTWRIKDGIIEHIELRGEELVWLQPLRGNQAMSLSCFACDVADLSPLKGMPLTTLDCSCTEVSDLSPLEGMELKFLDFTPERIEKGIEIIEAMETMIEVSPGEWIWRWAKMVCEKYDDGEIWEYDDGDFDE